jgi:uncharacterized protein YndB with AHSA1/START domain
MNTLTVIAIVAAVLIAAVAAVLVLAARKPATFRIARSTRIAAPPERIFELIEDFRAWSAWSPWERMDPDLKRTHSGAPRGRGAVYAWKGNRKVGQGRMEIVDAPASSRATIRLDFLKPFEAHNTAEFTLVPQGDATEVTWAMTGPNVFMGKVMGVFVDMDRMIGRDFERGLANLKAVAEGGPPAQAASA